MKRALSALLLCGAVMGVACAARAEPALLVRNAEIFSMASGEKAPFHGYFTVDDAGRIAQIGHGDPPAGLQARGGYDAHGHWVMPGFISAHSHLWQAAYRGLAADETLTGWLKALYGQTASRAQTGDYYWFTLYGALDHLSHGVTAAYNFNPGAAEREGFRGEAESGIRFVHGADPAHGSDHSLAASRAWMKDFLNWTHAQPGQDRLLSVMLNGWTAFRDDPGQAALEAALMKEFGLGNQSHYLEPPDQIAEEQAKFPLFQSSGLLGRSLIFGHFIHTTPQIIAATGQAGASMVWNPLSNGRLASGVADIPAYLKAGVRVGMGEDGEASADLVDPFENMRSGIYAIRDKYQDAAIMAPYDVVRLHTMGSADVLGVADRLGSLEVGKFADFLVIDPTHFAHVFDPYATLVFVASQQDLERVYVGGRQETDHGRLLHHDLTVIEGQVNQRVAQSLARPVPQGGWK